MKIDEKRKFENTARLLRVLGNPHRLMVVEALRKRSWCVCELAGHLGLNKSATSKHLALLKSVGVIEMEKSGTQVNCTLVMPCVFDMMYCAGGFDPASRVPGDLLPDPAAGRSAPPCASGCCVPGKENTRMEKTRIMFVCIHNSARSQMCEAFVRKYAGDRFEVCSSGIEAGKLNPLVVQAMEEIGVGMESHYAKPAGEFIQRNELFDYVVTVCDESSAERCPVFPGRHVRMHWGFPDPSALTGSDEEKLAGIRPIRDRIEKRVKEWLASL